ncbi:hypothetical protein DICA3_F15456 [Diutina catenulata]
MLGRLKRSRTLPKEMAQKAAPEPENPSPKSSIQESTIKVKRSLIRSQSTNFSSPTPQASPINKVYPRQPTLSRNPSSLVRSKSSATLSSSRSISSFKALPSLPEPVIEEESPAVTVVSSDSLFDQTSISVQDFEISHSDEDFDDYNLGKSKSSKSIEIDITHEIITPRTTNNQNLSSFIDMVYHSDVQLPSAGNKLSVEDERMEDMKLAHKLSATHVGSLTTRLHRIGGVHVLELATMSPPLDASILDDDYSSVFSCPYNEVIEV